MFGLFEYQKKAILYSHYHVSPLTSCYFVSVHLFLCLFCFPSLLLFSSLCPAISSAAFLHVAENLSEQIVLFSYYLDGGGWYYN